MTSPRRLSASADVRRVYAARRSAGTAHVVVHARARSAIAGGAADAVGSAQPAGASRGPLPRSAPVAAPPPGGSAVRATVVAGRRVGSAVVRNRAKRRLRECLRRSEVVDGATELDLVVTAKPGAAHVDHATLCAELDSALARAVERAAA